MIDPTHPAAPTPPPTNIEDILAHQANDAMAKGADAGAVTDRLGQSIRWLRSNPDAVNQAHGAIVQGANPVAVAGRIWQTAQKAPKIPAGPGKDYSASSSASGNITLPANPSTPAAQPSFLERAKTGLSNTLDQIVHHPLDSAASLITAPLTSAYEALAAPVVGSKRAESDYLRGKGIDVPNMAGYGETITKQNTPSAESPSTQLAGGLQTTANVLAGPLAKYVTGATAPVLGPLLSRLAGSAATGATVGAAYDPNDPGVGAVTGGVVGTILHPVGAAAESGLRKIAPASINPDNALPNRASRIILKNVDPTDLMTSVAGSGGKPVSVADLGGTGAQELLATASRVPSPGRAQVLDALDQRQQDQLGRMKGDVESALGLQDKNVYDLADQLMENRRKAAAPLYEAAFANSGPIDDPTVNRILNTPAGKQAYRQALVDAANNFHELPEIHRPIQRQSSVLGADGKPVMMDDIEYVKSPDLRTLDYVKKALDRQGRWGEVVPSGGTASTDAGTARNLSRQLVTALDAKVPEYGVARQQFAGDVAMSDALEQGGKFVNTDARLTTKMLRDMSPSEQEMYRIGALDNVRQVMDKSADGADLVKRVFGNTEKRAQLQSLINDPAAFEQLQSALGIESKMNRTRNTVTGNSSTDARRLASDEFDQMAGGVSVGQHAADLVTHPVRTLVGKGVDFANRARQGIVGQTASEVTRQLSAGSDGNTAAVQAVIQRLIKSAQRKRTPFINPSLARMAGTSQANQTGGQP